MSLSFDEDLGKPERSDMDNKAKYKKWKKRKGSDEPNQIPDNKRKKTRKEMMERTREEVYISPSSIWCLFVVISFTIGDLQVNADFKAVSSDQDPQERRRMQSQTLSAVFQTYFRILKCVVNPR